MMPHAKTDSKMQKKESLFAVNEIAEMKNCEKCLLFEGRKKKDIYLWAANIARGPSVKFEVTRFRYQYLIRITIRCTFYGSVDYFLAAAPVVLLP
jgi:ribosome biogenesis protein BRX1